MYEITKLRSSLLHPKNRILKLVTYAKKNNYRIAIFIAHSIKRKNRICYWVNLYPVIIKSLPVDELRYSVFKQILQADESNNNL